MAAPIPNARACLPEAAEQALIAESTAAIDGTRASRRAAGSPPGSPRAARRRSCWPRPATATRSTGAWTTSRSGWPRATAGCWRSPIRRRSTTSRPSPSARTAPSSSPPWCSADFEEMLDQVARDGIPQVMGIALHPYIIGQPYRLRRVARRARGDRGAAGRGLDHHGGRDLRPCRHAAGGDGAMTRLGGGLP